jgi:hypothetical protein
MVKVAVSAPNVSASSAVSSFILLIHSSANFHHDDGMIFLWIRQTGDCYIAISNRFHIEYAPADGNGVKGLVGSPLLLCLQCDSNHP